MMPSQFRPTTPDEFIGPARSQAKTIERMIALCKESGKAPIKLLILGLPGAGKTSLAEHFVKCVGSDKWSVHKFNGVQVKIEEVEELARSVHYTSLFGDYKIIRIEEVDKVPTVAQVRLLTLLDDLPNGVAVIATSNCRVGDLESRFQSRFQVIQLASPSDDEITEFLSGRWKLTTSIARQIATFANGNVRQALLDAQSYLVA
jgi:replication-associated recombination protein RarA